MDDALAWLLDPADPAVRAQALVDLAGRAPDDPEVLAARAEIPGRGSAAALLASTPLLDAEATRLYRPKYGAPFHRLIALAEMGMPAAHPPAGDLLDACLQAFYGPLQGPLDPDQEVCHTGNLARAAWRMGRGDDPRVAEAVAWLVRTQLPDGGWHCWPDQVPHGTIDAWEALGAFAAMPPDRRGPDVVRAAARGVDFLLDADLGLRDPYAPWRRLHFPRHYYYDVLVGLDLATTLGDPRDPRLRPALDWLRAKRRSDGTWRADAPHPDLGVGADYTLRAGEPVTPLEVAGADRWVTLAAKRVLARCGS